MGHTWTGVIAARGHRGGRGSCRVTPRSTLRWPKHETALVAHPLYGAVRTREHIRIFMKHHVFAVWDFFTLLKRLQAEVTCVTVPVAASGDGRARSLHPRDRDRRGDRRGHRRRVHQPLRALPPGDERVRRGRRPDRRLPRAPRRRRRPPWRRSTRTTSRTSVRGFVRHHARRSPSSRRRTRSRRRSATGARICCRTCSRRCATGSARRWARRRSSRTTSTGTSRSTTTSTGRSRSSSSPRCATATRARGRRRAGRDRGGRGAHPPLGRGARGDRGLMDSRFARIPAILGRRGRAGSRASYLDVFTR